MVNKKDDSPKIQSLASKTDETFIPTGILSLDDAIGGGVYRGRITELFGLEGVGKSFVATTLMANLTKNNKVLFVDAEFALNKERVIELGGEPKNIDYVADSQLERVCELIIEKTGQYDVIILDSLAYLTPLSVSSQEVGENAIGLFAREIKHWIVKFRPVLAQSKTAFVAINQYRRTLGLYAKAEPPGGRAWAHAVDVRVLLETSSKDKIIEKGTKVGHRVTLDVRKSKVSKPFKGGTFDIRY